MISSMPCVLLAAGKGSRMGGPKLYLQTSEQSHYWIQEQIASLTEAGIQNIVVVAAATEKKRIEALSFPEGIEWLWNEQVERGSFLSLQLALNCLLKKAKHSACYVLPIDVPVAKKETWQKLAAASQNHNDAVLMPCFKSRGGHPVLLPRLFQEQIVRCDPEHSGSRLDHLIKNYKSVLRIEVPDDVIVWNMNTPEEWQKWTSTKNI